MKIIGALALVFYLVAADFIPEEAAQIQIIDGEIGGEEGIFIKVNGIHRDNGEEVYMQVNLNVKIEEGNVLVNQHVLPLAELSKLELQAQISVIDEAGVAGDFSDADVTVNFFLHEQLEIEKGEVARAFRLETQIVETDRYDVHMFNVTEVVMELDTNQQEIRRTVTLISESESKLKAARNCPDVRCREQYPRCSAYKKDANGCATCQCAAAIDDFVPPTETNCFFANRMVSKFEELPYSLRLVLITLLAVIAFILTITCCVTVCCRGAVKEPRKNNNLKAFGFGKLQLYMPDAEKKMPLIDNLDVVSADIA